MSSYRFCRTDDISLLVDALNRCWAPYFPDEPPATEASFKRSIRDLQVWCSSCMVAFAGGNPIAVLIGAKRPSATLVHKIAVHPEHVRQGHGRHLLTSLSSKLAILGPPRLVAEVPETQTAACGLFTGCGYVEEASLIDYVWHPDLAGNHASRPNRLVIPVTFDDLVANGLLDGTEATVCWGRSVETLRARKDELAGIAIASDERIDAYVLTAGDSEMLALRSLIDDGGAGLSQLLTQLSTRSIGPRLFPKVHPGECAVDSLAALGFRPAGAHRLVAATAR